MIYEIYKSGQWVNLGSLDLLSCVLDVSNQEPATLTIVSENGQQFAVGDQIVIRAVDGNTSKIVFNGKIYSRPAFSSPEMFTYKASDALESLKTIPFKVDFNVSDGGFIATHLILYRDRNGEQMTAGAQIMAVLDYAISKGVAITYLQDDLDSISIAPPSDEMRDQTCYQVLQKILRWSPETVLKIVPHETDPSATPTIRFIDLSEAETITIDETEITGRYLVDPRDNLSVDGVHIFYEKTNADVAGNTTDSVEEDTAGDINGSNVISMTIELEGDKVQNNQLSSTITCLSLDWSTDQKKLDFCKAFFDGGITSISNLVICGWPGVHPDLYYGFAYCRSGSAPILYGNVISSGSYYSWMPINVQWVQIGVIATRYGYLDYKNIKTTYCTDSSSGTFTTSSPFIIPGEITPLGVAEYIYQQRRRAVFDGSIGAFDVETLERFPAIGDKLRITGSPAEGLDQMDSIIQRTSFDFNRSSLNLNFGLQSHLSVDDYITMLQASALRTKPARRTWRTV